MARLFTRAGLGVLFTALMASCAGGQTGQPDSGDSCAETVAPTSPIEDTTVAALARSFEGTHRAALHWEQTEPGGVRTPLDFADSITLEVTYGGDAAAYGCGSLDIPVTLTLTTEASGLSETGPALLMYVAAGTPRTAKLAYGDANFSLSATLTEVKAGASPSGSLESSTQETPSGFARIGDLP